MFPLVSMAFFAFIAFIWSSKDLPNVVFKLLFSAMFVWAAFESLKAFGWIVRA